ncbi:MAG: hypothetical protein KGL38_10600 [Gemmatimonadota bacterium]|nr:hypothetical protein [Gemmatimonadota bacterium]
MRPVLGDAIFWIAAVCCLVAQAAIIRSTLRPHVPAPAGQQVPRPRTPVEVAWVLLPALILAGVFVLTWHAMHPPRLAPSAQLSAAVAPLRAS